MEALECTGCLLKTWPRCLICSDGEVDALGSSWGVGRASLRKTLCLLSPFLCSPTVLHVGAPWLPGAWHWLAESPDAPAGVHLELPSFAGSGGACMALRLEAIRQLALEMLPSQNCLFALVATSGATATFAKLPLIAGGGARRRRQLAAGARHSVPVVATMALCGWAGGKGSRDACTVTALTLRPVPQVLKALASFAIGANAVASFGPCVASAAPPGISRRERF